MNIIYFFNLWKKNAEIKRSIREYDTFCELNNERLEEEYFAQSTHMDPSEWCWNCKYSDCDRHF